MLGHPSCSLRARTAHRAHGSTEGVTKYLSPAVRRALAEGLRALRVIAQLHGAQAIDLAVAAPQLHAPAGNVGRSEQPISRHRHPRRAVA